MRRHILTASLALFALAAPVAGRAATTVRTGGEAPVAGDGHKVTRARPFTAATVIRLEGAIALEVELGAPPALTVTIDENLQPRVETRLDGDTLIISTRSMHLEGAATVRITTPALRRLELEGSGDVSVRNGSGDFTVSLDGSGDVDWRGTAGALVVELAGSGDVTLAGKAAALRIRLAGSGDVDAGGLAAHDADAEIDGSGGVTLQVDGGALRAAIAGSGDIRWSGSATSAQSSVTGSGRVVRR